MSLFNLCNAARARIRCLPAMASARVGFFTAITVTTISISFAVISAMDSPMYEDLLLAVSLVLVLIIIAKTEIDFRRASRLSYTFEDEASRKEVIKRLMSHDDGTQESSSIGSVNLFPYERFDTGKNIAEFYTLKPETNLWLYNHSSCISVKYDSRCYSPPSELKEFYPFIMSELARKTRDKILFNGRLLRLMDDIDLKPLSITVKKVRYFDNIATNEQVMKRFRFNQSLNPSFDSADLLVTRDHKLRSFTEGILADIIGISTMVITKDSKMIIARQGLRSVANPGRLAPSGSGSVESRDVKKLFRGTPKDTLDKEHPISLETLLSRAAEREFLEESGWNRWRTISKWNHLSASLKTKIIGYSRLIERGGKPDFFAVSYIDENMAEIINQKKNAEVREGLMQECMVLDCEPKAETVIEVLKRLEQGKYAPISKSHSDDCTSSALEPSGISIQIVITRRILEDLLAENIDPYDTLIFSS